MKKLLSIVLGVCFCLGLIPMQEADAKIIGEVLSTDIVAFIDEQPIDSFNINDYTYIIAEDLRGYGFDVIWDGEKRTLEIERNKEGDRVFLPMEKINVKKADIPFRKRVFDVYETDIITYISGHPANAYNVDGQTLIMIDELSKYGYFSYDDEKRCVKIDMAGFDRDEILNNSSNQTIQLPCDKIEGKITYTGEIKDGKPNGYGVIHESYEYTNGLQSTEDYYYSGKFINGEKEGYVSYLGKRVPHNGSDRRVRDYFSLKRYSNGVADGYSLEIYYVEGELPARAESNGTFKRSIVSDESYRYGYRVESEGNTDSKGQIIDYEKTEAGNIKAVDAYQDRILIVAENGDLYGLGDLSEMRKDVPVKIDSGISSAASGYAQPSVIDKDGNLYYLWDKIYKYNNTDVPYLATNVKKTNEEFFLTNDGKLYQKQIQYGWTMYDEPKLIAENVKDFSANFSRMLFIKENGDVYFARFNSEGTTWMDNLDLSAPVKVFENAKAVSCLQRNLVIDKNDTLWGWSSDTYNTPYENIESVFSTKQPIKIAENVTSASSVSSFIAYTKNDGALYVCPDYTEPASEPIFGIKEKTKILDNVKQFTCHFSFIFAVKNDGTLWAWGKNSDGYLGLGGVKEITTPVQIKDFYSFKEK